LSRPRLGERDQFLDRFDGKSRVDDHQQRVVHDAHDRREVLERVVTDLRIHVRRDSVGRLAREIQRVAVGRRFSDDLGADRAGRADAVFDNE
jgi:hypothetical protein